jgi:hypothetical protein
MTDTGVVLSMFSALAVLAVGVILGAGVWARARRDSQDRRELAMESVGAERTPAWLTQPGDYRG